MDARRYTVSDADLRAGGLISMRGTVLQKRVFPLVAVLGLVLLVVLLRHTWPANMILLPAAIIMSVAGSILQWTQLRKQPDEVIDAGDHLIIRKDDEEVRIPLHDLARVSPTLWGVTLTLSESAPFGSTITFTPRRSLGRGAVVMSLRSRAMAARRPH